MNRTKVRYATIVSDLNVEDEAVRAFCVSLDSPQTVDEYVRRHHLYFSSYRIEQMFLGYLVVLTEIALGVHAHNG